MATEIELKWLVNLEDLPFDLEKTERHHIVQTYVSFRPQIRLRDYDHGTCYIMTVKPDRPLDGSLVRDEFEAEITAASYEDLAAQTIGRSIEKTRYLVPEPGTGRVFEIDVFEGDFAGLVTAEMEFATEEDALAYPTPGWVERDITHEAAYKNIVMAQS